MIHTFRMEALFAPLSLAGPDLLLREYGRVAYPILAQQLNAVPPGDVLVLDFQNVRVMDSSFADETLAQLLDEMLAGQFPDRFVILRNLSENAALNLSDRIGQRKVRGGFLRLTNRGWEIVGHIERNLDDVLHFVAGRGGTVARDVADKFGLEINTASTRLKKLYETRLLRRREEIGTSGRFHVYETLT